jgi:hypothetical protein
MKTHLGGSHDVRMLYWLLQRLGIKSATRDFHITNAFLRRMGRE